MQELTALTRPGAMISQIWPRSRENQGETLKAIETVLECGFYRALQTVEIPFPDERKQIAAIVSQHQVSLTYCVSRVLTENKLNLSDLDATNRKKSCDAFQSFFDEASEAGAGSISMISGPGPGDPRLRQQALNCLLESLMHICEEAKKYPNLQIWIEPLDIHAHKKNTFGTMEEGVMLCNALKQQGLELFLCMDTAHAHLNREDPVHALKLSKPFVKEFHFCNCVVDEAHPLYGDNHIPFGRPGVIDQTAISNIMKESAAMSYYNETDKPVILCEVFNRGQEDGLFLLNQYKDILMRAWEDAQMQPNPPNKRGDMVHDRTSEG